MASSNTTSAASAASTTSNEVEETLARIRSHKGVEGVLIMTKEGESSGCSEWSKDETFFQLYS